MLFNINFFAILLLIVISIVYHHANADNAQGNINETIADIFWKNYEVTLRNTSSTVEPVVSCGTGDDTGIHECVPSHRCDVYELSEEERIAVAINIRFMSSACLNSEDVCCRIQYVLVEEESGGNSKSSGHNKTITEHGSGVSAMQIGISEPVGAPIVCGYHNADRIQDATDIDLEKGEFPWMTVIQGEELFDENSKFYFVGTLIHPQVVLMAAHSIYNMEWKLTICYGECTPKMLNENNTLAINVKSVTIHPNYTDNAKVRKRHNNIALLFLESPIQMTEYVNVVCLPPQGSVIHEESFHHLTGYGGEDCERTKVGVEIMSIQLCERKIRRKKSKSKTLHNNFICTDKKSDFISSAYSGGPMVSLIPGHKNRYYLVGIFVGRMRCIKNNNPLYLFLNVAHRRDWITEQLLSKHLEATPYNYQS